MRKLLITIIDADMTYEVAAVTIDTAELRVFIDAKYTVSCATGRWVIADGDDDGIRFGCDTFEEALAVIAEVHDAHDDGGDR